MAASNPNDCLSLSFHFPGAYNTFYINEKLEGEIRLEIFEESVIQSLDVELQGRLSIRIEKDGSLIPEDYIYLIMRLPKNLHSNAGGFVTEKGTYPFPLDFTLDCQVPSIESTYIRVLYELKATCYFTSGSKNYHVEKMKMIYVNPRKSPLQFSNSKIARYHIPQREILNDAETCACISYVWPKSGINARVSVPRKGWVSGEPIIINAEIENLSSVPILYTKACVVQVIRTNIPKVTKFKIPIGEQIKGIILPGDTQCWDRATIPLPPLPTTYSNKLMSIYYRIWFQVCFGDKLLRSFLKFKRFKRKMLTIKVPFSILDCPLPEPPNKVKLKLTNNVEYPLKEQWEYMPFEGPSYVSSIIHKPYYKTYIPTTLEGDDLIAPESSQIIIQKPPVEEPPVGEPIINPEKLLSNVLPPAEAEMTGPSKDEDGLKEKIVWETDPLAETASNITTIHSCYMGGGGGDQV